MAKDQAREPVRPCFAVYGLDRLEPAELALADKVAANLEAIGAFEQDGPEPAHLPRPPAGSGHGHG